MLIVEGIDGTGKTSIVSRLKDFGMNTVFYDYDPLAYDLIKKYKNINIVKNGVSDRSFISELTYGNVVRGHSRLTEDDYKILLDFYASLGTDVIYLKANLRTLLERRQDDQADLELLYKFFEPLAESYDKAIQIAKQYLPVHEYDTADTTVDKILDSLKKRKVIRIGTGNNLKGTGNGKTV